MHNYRHINPIRDEKGKLREWKDYNWITIIENQGDNQLGSDSAFNYKHKFIDNERSKVQR